LVLGGGGGFWGGAFHSQGLAALPGKIMEESLIIAISNNGDSSSKLASILNNCPSALAYLMSRRICGLHSRLPIGTSALSFEWYGDAPLYRVLLTLFTKNGSHWWNSMRRNERMNQSERSKSMPFFFQSLCPAFITTKHESYGLGGKVLVEFRDLPPRRSNQGINLEWFE
jgi:hypothetical protein